uniref:Uncharacterized protein n=1 Tax=Lotharella oceanica TaxID=641309 RepID=A0A7S2TTQ9_9EUKA
MDGAGECLQWLFEGKLANPLVWDAWYQTHLPTDWLSQYHQHARVEISSTTEAYPHPMQFYIYVPRKCRKGFRCRVHVQMYGCGDAPSNPMSKMPVPYSVDTMYAREDSRLLTSNYHVWAASNDIVVIYPIHPLNPYRDTHRATWGEVGSKHCWDSYGEGGDDYATQAGEQMRQIRRAIALVKGEQG